MAPPPSQPLALAAIAQTAPPRTADIPAIANDSLPPDVLELLYRHMRALAGPRRDLDDLVQAAAVRLIRALPRFQHRSTLSTFAYGVAYRTLLGHDRWYKRWALRFSFADDQREVPMPAASADVEETALRARRASSLHRALAQLPASKRAVIILHDLEEMEMKEVAVIVDSNERTVRSRLRDGRKKLAEILARDPLFDAEAR
jgi:RNA polymerase sigma-70 factor (ECF subfamily)